MKTIKIKIGYFGENSRADRYSIEYDNILGGLYSKTSILEKIKRILEREEVKRKNELQ